MNVKTLRNNYQNLTLGERLSLMDAAVFRRDESEARAIVAASPRESFSQPDYLNLLEDINRMRLCNLVTRLSYVMQFDYFSNSEIDSLKQNWNHAQLAAYLYVRATDAWERVAAEFGLQAGFNEQINDYLFSGELLAVKDKILRGFAFTEEEAAAFVKAETGAEKIQTPEDEIKAMKKALGL